jgi:hypothetical protein
MRNRTGKKARALKREEKSGGEERKREKRGEATRGEETSVEAKRSAAMDSEASTRFRANGRDEGTTRRCRRRDEMRRGEVRQRGERARALKAVRTPQKPNHRSIGAGYLNESTGPKTEQPPSPLLALRLSSALQLASPLLGAASHTEQQSEATHMGNPMGKRQRKNKTRRLRSPTPLRPLWTLPVCCLGQR